MAAPEDVVSTAKNTASATYGTSPKTVFPNMRATSPHSADSAIQLPPSKVSEAMKLLMASATVPMTSAAAPNKARRMSFEARNGQRPAPRVSTVRKVPQPYSVPVNDAARIMMRMTPNPCATARPSTAMFGKARTSRKSPPTLAVLLPSPSVSSSPTRNKA